MTYKTMKRDYCYMIVGTMYASAWRRKKKKHKNYVRIVDNPSIKQATS
jgi:hypothetical protein